MVQVAEQYPMTPGYAARAELARRGAWDSPRTPGSVRPNRGSSIDESDVIGLKGPLKLDGIVPLVGVVQ
jgi:hypothetical protein